MPGFTPTFGIQYPCGGETIDSAVFQTFADDVEAALASVDALSASALTRPRAAMRGTATSVPFATNTQVTTFGVPDFATGITTAATGFTTITSGVYIISFDCNPTNNATTATSWGLLIRRSGVLMYQRRVSPNPADLRSRPLNLTGMMTLSAATPVTFDIFWTGTGANIAYDSRATIAKISEL